MQATHVAADEGLLGAVVPVRIEAASANSLAGRIEQAADGDAAPDAPRQGAAA
jgi:hypothetical protein